MGWGPEFADRQEAGRRLAAALEPYRGEGTLVLALPRGGVPVALEVARALDAELDLLVVRKIGAPFHEELGIGAVVGGVQPEILVDPQLAAMVGASPEYVERKAREALAEIDRRNRAWRGGRAEPDPEGRAVIVVDDGIATGGTMKAALRALRRRKPSRLVLAVPVAPPEAIESLAPECDAIICLEQPPLFGAVGSHYADFRQVEDAEVLPLLAQAAANRAER